MPANLEDKNKEKDLSWQENIKQKFWKQRAHRIIHHM